MPLLKKSKEASSNTGLIVQTRATPEPQDNSAIEACAMELIIAIHTKDVKAVAEAIKNAFDILESNETKEHVEPHSYSAQNIKAGEQR